MNEGLGFVPVPTSRKFALNGLAGLAGLQENRYIRGNLWFSYDRVLRVGPSGPALFYYPNEPPQINDAGLARVAQPGRPEGPASTQCKLDQF